MAFVHSAFRQPLEHRHRGRGWEGARGGVAFEVNSPEDRTQSSDEEHWADSFEAYCSDELAYSPEIESMPDGEAMAKCKFSDGDGALYVKAVGAYASALEAGGRVV